MALNNLYNRINQLQQFDILPFVQEIITENSYYLIGLLRKQLQQGKDALGDPVTLKRRGGTYDFYSDATIREKERYGTSALGKQTSFVTNYMSGSFYNSLEVEVAGSTFQFVGNVPYFERILQQSGGLILELSQEHLKEFQEEILIPQLEDILALYGL